MQRRAYLRGTATLGAMAITGCLGAGDANPNVALPAPDRPFESADVPYPAWGQRIPDVTVPAPLDGRQVALRSVDKPRLLTFFYSHCATVCPVLVSTMRNVQTHALNHGYGEEVAFFPTTFDPERDTPERLEQYAEEMNVDVHAGNWHFLRPTSTERAKLVVSDAFGVAFQRSYPEDMEGYMFTHSALTLLVNEADYVERAYRTKNPDAEAIIQDLETVRSA